MSPAAVSRGEAPTQLLLLLRLWCPQPTVPHRILSSSPSTLAVKAALSFSLSLSLSLSARKSILDRLPPNVARARRAWRPRPSTGCTRCGRVAPAWCWQVPCPVLLPPLPPVHPSYSRIAAGGRANLLLRLAVAAGGCCDERCSECWIRRSPAVDTAEYSSPTCAVRWSAVSKNFGLSLKFFLSEKTQRMS